MPLPSIVCYLYEPDGTLISAATQLFEPDHAEPTTNIPAEPAPPQVVATGLDHAGRLVNRCLLGPTRTLWLQLRDGALLPAQVERVFFDPDPTHGRSCVLRLTSTDLPVDERAAPRLRPNTEAGAEPTTRRRP